MPNNEYDYPRHLSFRLVAAVSSPPKRRKCESSASRNLTACPWPSAYNVRIVVDWNAPLKLGLTGLAAALRGGVWLTVQGLLQHGVPPPWLVALGLLFLLSALTVLGSQVTIESRLSWGSGTDGDDGDDE